MDRNGLRLGLGLGSKLSDRFSVGVRKIYFATYPLYICFNLRTDLGLHYKTKNDKVRIGMSIANFGPDMAMDGKDLFKKIDIDPDNSGHNELGVKLKTDPWPLPLF